MAKKTCAPMDTPACAIKGKRGLHGRSVSRGWGTKKAGEPVMRSVNKVGVACLVRWNNNSFPAAESLLLTGKERDEAAVRLMLC